MSAAMWVEAITRPIRYHLDLGGIVHLAPGCPVELGDAQGRSLLAKAAGKVRIVAHPPAHPIGRPVPPLAPGMLIAWFDAARKLQGGAEHRAKGTVKSVEFTATGFVIVTEDGSRVPERRIVSVARTDATGHVIAAWLVRAYGLDGNKKRQGT